VNSQGQPGVRRPLVLGDSRGDLPGARKEARKVAQRLGTEAILGADVVRSRINGMLGECDLLHVSCHARFDHNSPERSGFVLADGGIFSARDGLKLRLNSGLAVLSACESGRMNVKAGDELTGIASSLLSAGVRSIAATSWRIPDSATARLIDEFYAGLLDRQVSVACALRDAQQRVYSNSKYSLPYYWAAFRVLGDWRNRFAVQSGGGSTETR
jgi:CHAT domain-containing protein